MCSVYYIELLYHIATRKLFIRLFFKYIKKILWERQKV